MNVSQFAYLSAALLGMTGVIAGAMGAHALEKTLTTSQLDSFETAVRFQMYHAFFIMMVGLLMARSESLLLNWTFGLALIGTLLFSGSIYLLVLTSARVGIITPIGGTLLIAAWAVLGVWAVRGA